MRTGSSAPFSGDQKTSLRAFFGRTVADRARCVSPNMPDTGRPCPLSFRQVSDRAQGGQTERLRSLSGRSFLLSCNSFPTEAPPSAPFRRMTMAGAAEGDAEHTGSGGGGCRTHRERRTRNRRSPAGPFSSSAFPAAFPRKPFPQPFPEPSGGGRAVLRAGTFPPVPFPSTSFPSG